MKQTSLLRTTNYLLRSILRIPLRTTNYHLRTSRSGFTLIEVIISVAVLSLVVGGIVTFQRDLFFLNDSLREALLIEQQAGPVIKEVVAELRTASPSSVGSYVLAAVSSTSLTFYTNIDTDVQKERVRYFKEGDMLKKGLLEPTGDPLTYDLLNEKVKPVVKFLAATTTPLFSYYDENYAGTTTPLTEPIDILAVRLVKLTLVIDKDPLKLPDALTFVGQALIRSLKENE